MDNTQKSAFFVYKKINKRKLCKTKSNQQYLKKRKPNVIDKIDKKKISRKQNSNMKPLGVDQSVLQVVTHTTVVSKKFNNSLNECINNKTLSWIMSPHSTCEFFKNCWEQHIFYIKRNSPQYYSRLLTSKKLDKMLRENSLYFTKNVDVVFYENEQRETLNPTGRATPAVVWDFYENGCSVRILNPQTYNENIYVLLSTLQEYFGTMVGANVYLTPPASQGFAPHFDDIEAFVLQLEGRKHWKLYKPKECYVLARNSSCNLKRNELSDPIKEVTLEAGDFLYFPRGTIHEAFTDAEAHSLHITVSVYQHTAYVDLLEKILPAALEKACRSDVNFRQGLPLNYLRQVGCANLDNVNEIRNNIINKVKNLMCELTQYIDVDKAADSMGRKFMHDALPPVMCKNEQSRTSRENSEHLINGKVEERFQFTSEVKVRLLRYHVLHLVVEEDAPSYIYYCTENSKVYHGEEEQSLEIDQCAVPIIKTLLNRYPKYTKIALLPCSDKELKLRVIADLWEKELLVTKKALCGNKE